MRGFKLFPINVFYIIPKPLYLMPILYFIFIFFLQWYVRLLSRVFTDENSHDMNTDTIGLFWFLTIFYWTTFIVVAGYSIFDRSEHILEECTNEFIIEYFKIRPQRSSDVHERVDAWENLAESTNNYIHANLDTYNKSVMNRFNLTGNDARNFVKALITQFDSKKASAANQGGENDDVSVRDQLLSKLKQAQRADELASYGGVIENLDSLHNGGSSSIKEVV